MTDDEDVIAEIERLAALEAIDYEAARKQASKRLSFRAQVLDEEVARKRRQLGLDTRDRGEDGQGRAVKVPDVIPSAEPVGGDCLADTLSRAIRVYVALPDIAADTIALSSRGDHHPRF